MEICWDIDVDRYVLHWSRPVSYEEYSDNPIKIEKAYFYSISSQWTDNEDRLIYIGMTYKQDVLTRMKQHGINKCQQRYPKKCKTLFISVAEIIEHPSVKSITEDSVKDIEALLIYGSWNESMVNEKNINTYAGRLDKQIMINNTGFTLLADKIFWGVSSSG